MAETYTEGRRIYIKTKYGEACVGLLKQAGAHWDSTHKAWWVSIAKKSEVEKILHAEPEQLEEAQKRETKRQLERDRNNILGRAKYDGTSYYVVAHGENSRGDWVKLLFRDGSKTFYKAAADVEITKEYEKPTTLAKLQAFAESLQAEKDESLPFIEECWECGAQYRTYGNVWDMNMSCRRCG